MKKFFPIFAILFLSACNNIKSPESQIIESADINIIEKELNEANKDTLVIFDCDEVLSTPGDQIVHKKNKQFMKNYLAKHGIKGKEKDKFLTSIFLQIKPKHVNSKMPEIINNLQNKNIKTIVLTGLSSKPWGVIQDPIEWRIETLHTLGYHFEKSFNNNEKMKLKLEKDDDSFDPIYKSGVLCCGEISKGKCLDAFLKYFKISPKTIIFIDDKKSNLEDVKNSLSMSKAKFIGIEYSEKIVYEPFSEKTAEYRLNYFKGNGVLLPER